MYLLSCYALFFACLVLRLYMIHSSYTPQLIIYLKEQSGAHLCLAK